MSRRFVERDRVVREVGRIAIVLTILVGTLALWWLGPDRDGSTASIPLQPSDRAPTERGSDPTERGTTLRSEVPEERTEGALRGQVEHRRLAHLRRASGVLSVAAVGKEGVSVPFDLPVRDGCWTISRPGVEALVVHGGELDGTTVWPAAPDVAIDGHAPTIVLDSAPLVWIVDHLGGEELDQVSVFCRDALPGRHLGTKTHLGLVDTGTPSGTAAVLSRVVRDHEGPSPVPFDRLDRACTYLVTAPGYTWGRLDVDPGSPTTSVLGLRRGGALRLWSTGPAPVRPEQGRLELFSTDPVQEDVPDYRFDLELRAASHRIDKIEVGEYRLAVQVDDGGTSTTIHEGQVSIRSGFTEEVGIDWSRWTGAPAPTEVMLLIHGDEGTVGELSRIVITGRPFTGRTARVSLSRPADVFARRPGVIECSAVPLDPGDWRIALHPIGHVQGMRVPQEDHHLHEVRVPAARPHEVTVVDGSSGEPVALRAIQAWTSAASGGKELEAVPPIGYSPVAASNPARFSAIPGWMKLAIFTEDHGPLYTLVDARSDRSLRVELLRPVSIEIRLSSRGAPFHAPADWWTRMTLHTPDGEPVDGRLEFEPGPILHAHAGVELSVEEGRFVLGLGALPGRDGGYSLDLSVRRDGVAYVLDVDSGEWLPGPAHQAPGAERR